MEGGLGGKRCGELTVLDPVSVRKYPTEPLNPRLGLSALFLGLAAPWYLGAPVHTRPSHGRAWRWSYWLGGGGRRLSAAASHSFSGFVFVFCPRRISSQRPGIHFSGLQLYNFWFLTFFHFALFLENPIVGTPGTHK